jgi:hypothetical protein
VDDVASGAVLYLAGFPALTSLLGSIPASDPNPTNRGRPFLFRGELLFDMEGTQQAAIVCRPEGGWGSSTQYASQRFERLSVEIYVDSLRDAGHNVTGSPGATAKRLETIFNTVQSILHRTDPAAVLWGDLATVACTLLAEGATQSTPDGD